MKPKELTLRGLILGALITTVFTAANVYLGLKVGLTFASSIPAAVISMAILSAVKDSSILENNIVQTVASAAGTLSAIIFVLPGLVIVGWWTGFPFWQSFLICVSGGVLGVLFTIPLRRALVTTSDLPYPEGVAAAEVLKVGSGTRGETKDDTGEAREGLRRRDPRLGRVGGTRDRHGDAHRRRARSPASSASAATASSGYNIAWSLALLGAGHLVGLSVGMAMLVGPGDRVGDRRADPDVDAARRRRRRRSPRTPTTIWRTQVRFIGAGAIAVAAIYTLAKLAKPVVGGLVSTLAASRAVATGDDTRPRSLAAVDHRAHGRVPGRSPAWLAFTFAQVDGARAERGDADADRRAVRAARRLPHRRRSAATWRGSSARRTARSPASAFCRSCICASMLVARRARRRRRRGRRSSRSRCSSRRSSSPARRSRTTTCRI